MPPTTIYEFSDIVLVPFPFTDQTSSKKRPAVVVSSTAYNNARPDLILMAITGHQSPVSRIGEVSVSDWKKAGLLKPSTIKPIVTTIEKGLVTRTLGRLESLETRALRDSLFRILG
jgi:mRNA interferase MazF